VSGEHGISLVLETITFLGLLFGIICLLAGLVIKAIDGQWLPTTALLIEESDPLQARWMTDDGSLHVRELDQREVDHAGDSETVEVFYRRMSPHRMRFHRKSEAERVFWLLFIVIGGVGGVCFVISAIRTIAAGA